MGRMCGTALVALAVGLASAARAQEKIVEVVDKKGTIACERGDGAAPLNPDGYAVIIGNKSYREGIPAVEYAHNDAAAVCKLVVDRLGYRPRNVFVIQDASKETLDDWLGGEDFDGYLAKRLGSLAAEAEILVYYSGHGVPGTEGAFLLPVTAGPLEVARKGYPLQLLTKKLADLGAKQTLLILEACFSGRTAADARGLVPGTSYAVKGKAVPPTAKLAILAAAGPDQVANWDREAKLGLMTARLVAAVAGEADADRDGRASLAEIQRHLLEELPDRSFAIGRDRIQHPSLTGPAERWSFLVPPKRVVVPDPVVTPKPKVEPVVGLSGDAALKPGEETDDCGGAGWCPRMVVIPAGRFEQGATSVERAWYLEQGGTEEWANWEQPRHGVTIGKAFALGKLEVTVGQFRRFVERTGHKTDGGCRVFNGTKFELDAGKSWRDPGFPQTDAHPVVCVSWDDAKAYVAWLSKETGKAYRLPSESEWEYAARGSVSPTTVMRYWGDDKGNSEACAFANAADQTAKEKFGDWTVLNCRDGEVYTARAGRYRANGFGLFDMLGNVWEWTEDPWYDSYNGAPTDGSARVSGQSSSRVVRGGSWDGSPRILRVAFRNRYAPEFRYINIGFRVARMLTS